VATIPPNPKIYPITHPRNLAQLDQANWQAVNSTVFRDPKVKDGKQAEFLLHESLPWDPVEKIGVDDTDAADAVQKAIAAAAHQPLPSVEAGWYP